MANGGETGCVLTLVAELGEACIFLFQLLPGRVGGVPARTAAVAPADVPNSPAVDAGGVVAKL